MPALAAVVSPSCGTALTSPVGVTVARAQKLSPLTTVQRKPVEQQPPPSEEAHAIWLVVQPEGSMVTRVEAVDEAGGELVQTHCVSGAHVCPYAQQPPPRLLGQAKLLVPGQARAQQAEKVEDGAAEEVVLHSNLAGSHLEPQLEPRAQHAGFAESGSRMQ
jgi:hypothetical protein